VLTILKADTFWTLLERRVEATPDRVMFVDSEGRSVTFAEVKSWAERTAAGLWERGVRPGTAVTWQLPTRIETVVTSLALCRIGAVQNPIIHMYRAKEVAYCILNTGARLVLHPGVWGGFDYAAMLAEVAPEVDTLCAYDGLPSGDPAVLPQYADLDIAAPEVRWIYTTSGTTSDPKCVKHTEGTLIAAGLGLAEALDRRADDVGSIGYPYAHIGGPDYLVMMLAVGIPAVLIERFVIGDALQVYRRAGVTMAGGGTAFYQMLLNEQRAATARGEDHILPSLRLLSGGGAPKPPEVNVAVRSLLGVRISHGYGMTECPMIAQGRLSDTDEQLENTEGRPVRGSVVTVVRADGSVAEVGEEGELCVSGPMVCKGYTDPALTAAAFDSAGRFRTGDLGQVRADGHVKVTGRLKDVIIRKGENISAREIEDVVHEHPLVDAAAVIGLPDADRGERVCVVVERRPGASEELKLPDLVAHCRAAGLMTQKLPEQLVVVDALPRNATLKILKHELRVRLQDVPWP
jgi:cyclohexanecarboxylate-CoA ligase